MARKDRTARVVVDRDERVEILSGHSYCFRDPQAAERQSRRVTTNPGIETLEHDGRWYYLALGDDYITDSGERGTHYYGRGGAYVQYVVGD